MSATSIPKVDASSEYTDAHLAGMFASEALEGSYCWTSGLGWLHWTGRRWKYAEKEDVEEVARRWVLGKHKEATENYSRIIAEGGNGESAWNDAKSWKSFLHKSRVDALADMGKGIVMKDASQFDANPDLLNVANGVIDLRTGKLTKHSPEYLMTKMAPVAYIEDASHPDWDKALESIPKEIRDWYQSQLGQGITGYMNPSDLMLVQQGAGENGKSTIVAPLHKTLGDYSLIVSPRALLADASAIPAELAEFQGVRLAFLEELPEGRKLNVTRLKTVVGTPLISARRLYKQPVTFAATHTLIVDTNYLPVVDETDHGTWRRLALIKFPYTWRKCKEDVCGENDRLGDARLRSRLENGAKQHQAILSWLVDGAKRWYADNKILPDIPQLVLDDTREWRKDADLILSYADERLEFDTTSHVMASDLLADFNAWITSNGHHSWSKETFAARFGSHDEVSKHNVVKKHTRVSPGLSRPDTACGDAPGQYRAWFGVGYAEDASDDLFQSLKDKGV